MSKRVSTALMTSHDSVSVESESECDDDFDAQLTLTESSLLANLDSLSRDVTITEDPFPQSFLASFSTNQNDAPNSSKQGSAFTTTEIASSHTDGDEEADAVTSCNDGTLKRTKRSNSSRDTTANTEQEHVTSTSDLERTPTREHTDDSADQTVANTMTSPSTSSDSNSCDSQLNATEVISDDDVVTSRTEVEDGSTAAT